MEQYIMYLRKSQMDKDFEEEETVMRGGGTFAVDPELYAMLKNLCVLQVFLEV